VPKKIHKIESELFEQLVAWIATYIKPVQLNANCRSIGLFVFFYWLSRINTFVLNWMNHSNWILRMEDTLLSKKAVGALYRKWCFSGWNTAADHDYGSQYVGKSAILRQTALIVLLAQMGVLFLQIVSGWELSIRYSPGLVPAIIFRWENPLYGRNEWNSFYFE
jgi:DNA mismatch repair protein MutS